MTELPADVQETLGQVLAEAQERVDDPEVSGQLVDTARRVTTNKVPEGALKERLLIGCDAVTEALAEDEQAVAVEYLASMERRVSEAGSQR